MRLSLESRFAFALGLACAVAPLHADVTVTISACTSNDECNLVVTGDPGELTIALAGGTEFDRLNVGMSFAGPRVPTVPDLGAVNNVGREPVITFSGPVSARVDFDGPTFSGGTLSVGGASEPFVQSGSTWSATAVATPPEPLEPIKPVVITWTAPTENTDDTPLTDLAGYKIYWGTTPGGPYPDIVEVSAPTTTRLELTEADGLIANLRYYFVATAFNAEQTESARSNEANKLVQHGRVPVDPGPLSTTNVQIVYAIFQTTDRVTLVPIGTVGDDVECDPQMSVQDLNRIAYRVPQESVDFLPGSQSEVAFAECAAP